MDTASPTSTRLIMMGDAALCAGFDLVGFETYPGADEKILEQVLRSVLDAGQTALVLLEPRLARCDCPVLKRLRRQGGRVVITEIPPLHAPDDYRPQVESLVQSVLGRSALE